MMRDRDVRNGIQTSSIRCEPFDPQTKATCSGQGVCRGHSESAIATTVILTSC